MKPKKLIAAAAAFAVLGSFAVMPASAAENTVKISASVAAQVRSDNAEWTLKNKNTKIVSETDDIETTGKSGQNPVYFSAYYYFDTSGIPDGATITSATLDIYQGSEPFSKKTFSVASAEVPDDPNDIDMIWSSVSGVMGPDNCAASAADAEMVELSKVPDIRVMRADVTDFVSDGADAYSFIAYNKQRDDGNRRLSGKATLDITYTYTEPIAGIIEGSKTTADAPDGSSAAGFIAEVKTTDIAATALGIKVGGTDKGAKAITTMSGGGSAFYKVIVNGADSADNITVYVR